MTEAAERARTATAPRTDPRQLADAFGGIPGDVVINITRDEPGLQPQLNSFVGPRALLDARADSEDRSTHEPVPSPYYAGTLILHSNGTYTFRDLWPAR